MLPNYNYRWTCKKCGKELFAVRDEMIHATMIPPTCPEPGCGGEMEGHSLVHSGPFPENPFKHY